MKNKKKKNIMITLIIIASLLLFVLITGNHLIYGKYITEKTKSQLIEALNNDNFEAIRDLFSKHALRDAEDFEKGLSYLREICIGECKVYGDGGGRNGINVGQGVTYYEYDKTYRITIDSVKHVLYFIYFTGPTRDDKGLYSLGIVQREKREDSAYNSGQAGIYHPGWD